MSTDLYKAAGWGALGTLLGFIAASVATNARLYLLATAGYAIAAVGTVIVGVALAMARR